LTLLGIWLNEERSKNNKHMLEISKYLMLVKEERNIKEREKQQN
jgi:hypothetical protein